MENFRLPTLRQTVKGFIDLIKWMAIWMLGGAAFGLAVYVTILLVMWPWMFLPIVDTPWATIGIIYSFGAGMGAFTFLVKTLKGLDTRP